MPCKTAKCDVSCAWWWWSFYLIFPPRVHWWLCLAVVVPTKNWATTHSLGTTTLSHCGLIVIDGIVSMWHLLLWVLKVYLVRCICSFSFVGDGSFFVWRATFVPLFSARKITSFGRKSVGRTLGTKLGEKCDDGSHQPMCSQLIERTSEWLWMLASAQVPDDLWRFVLLCCALGVMRFDNMLSMFSTTMVRKSIAVPTR